MNALEGAKWENGLKNKDAGSENLYAESSWLQDILKMEADSDLYAWKLHTGLQN